MSIDVAPGVFWDSLNSYNLDQNCGWTIAKLEVTEGKTGGFEITKKSGEDEQALDLKVKIKFYGKE